MSPGRSQGAWCGPGTGQCTHCQLGSWCLLRKICQALAPSPFPKGAVPSLWPRHYPGAATSFEGSSAHLAEPGRAETERSCPLSPVCDSSALHRVKGPPLPTLRGSALGASEEGAALARQLFLAGLLALGSQPQSPARRRLPHTAGARQGYAFLHLSREVPRIRSPRATWRRVTEREGRGGREGGGAGASTRGGGRE